MKNKKLLFVLILLVSLISLLGVSATVINVPDDNATIQGAITSASSGDTINVSAGNYTEDLVISTDIILQGAGLDTTTIDRSSETNQIILINASDVTINGFKIDGGSFPYAVSNIIKLSTVGDVPYDNIEITDNHLLHSKGMAVNFYADPPAGFNASRNYTINDNIIEYYAGDSCDAGGCQYRGIGVGKALDVEIKRNVINNSNSWEYRSDNFTNGGYAIYLKDYSGGVVADNIISKCLYGIIANSVVEETFINNNTITECHRGIVTGEVFAKVYITDNSVNVRRDPVNPVDLKNVNVQGILMGGDGDWYDSSPPYAYEVDNLQHEISGNVVTGTNATDSFGLGAMTGWWDKDYGVSGNFTNNNVSGFKYGIKVWGTYTSWSGGGTDMTSNVNVAFSGNRITGSTTDSVVANWTRADEGISAINNYWGSTEPSVSSKYEYFPFYIDSEETSGADYEDFDGDTTDFNNEVDITDVSDATFEDTSYGKIVYQNNVNAEGQEFDVNIVFSDNLISINSENLDSSFNTSADLSLYNVNINDPVILKDGLPCGADCTNVVTDGSEVNFTVTGFSSYSVTADSNLTIWDSTDVEGGNESIYKDEDMTFTGNYTLSNGTIINGTCEIRFDVGGWGSLNGMTFNNTAELYEYNRSFATGGTHNFNVSCNSSVSSFVVSAVDDFSIGCNESWSPYYTTCTIGDNHTLLYNDTTVCGTVGDLPVDNNTIESCNYCTVSYHTNDTVCIDYRVTTYPTYDNFASCCNVTSIPADCNLPANTSITCVGLHESGDIPSVAVDSLVEVGRNFVSFAGLIAMFGLFLLLL